jgi:hypothetical protein
VSVDSALAGVFLGMLRITAARKLPPKSFTVITVNHLRSFEWDDRTAQSVHMVAARVLTGGTPEGIRYVLGECQRLPRARRLFEEELIKENAPSDSEWAAQFDTSGALKRARVKAKEMREDGSRYGAIPFMLACAALLLLAWPPTLGAVTVKPPKPKPHTCSFHLPKGCAAVYPADPAAECAWRPSWKKPLRCEAVL